MIQDRVKVHVEEIMPKVKKRSRCGQVSTAWNPISVAKSPFSHVAFKHRQLMFVANTHLCLAAIAFETADGPHPRTHFHRWVSAGRTLKLYRHIAQFI